VSHCASYGGCRRFFDCDSGCESRWSTTMTSLTSIMEVTSRVCIGYCDGFHFDFKFTYATSGSGRISVYFFSKGNPRGCGAHRNAEKRCGVG